MESHTAFGLKHGLFREELAEIAYITSALNAGAAAAHGMMAMKLYEHAVESAAVAKA
jgi:hypothetical protein